MMKPSVNVPMNDINNANCNAVGKNCAAK